jgi:enolase
MSLVTALHAREILDSRGNPTLEVDLVLDDGSRGRAAVPAGASTGSREAKEARDGDARYSGKGVRHAVDRVEGPVAAAICGEDAVNTAAFDARLIRLDGSPDKSRLGANTLLAVSMAAARAAAASRGEPLYRFLARDRPPTLLPVPMFNVLNGGAHADNSLDFQEFMIAPVGAPSFAEALRYGAEVYHALKSLLKANSMSVAVGDEGGFAPNLHRGEDAIEAILKAIEKAGLKPGVDVVLALDPAASELFDNGSYVFRKAAAGSKTSLRMINLYERWLDDYPAIWSIEDGLAEDDWPGWMLLTARLGERVQLVGDDIFVTNPEIIRRAIREQVGNAALIKLNQIGTVSETLEAIAVSQQAGYGTVISHRSGETPDDFIADLAVAAGAGQIKSGAPARGERTAKYNQLLRIEQELGAEARYAGKYYSSIRAFRPEHSR